MTEAPDYEFIENKEIVISMAGSLHELDYEFVALGYEFTEIFIPTEINGEGKHEQN